ncbi:MAG: ABC transporter ATP-binding protein, partial [Streptococcaceae bacterium]|nr:ABC transporter ATP-binding protein [Streptococcaceae bacterium]
ITHDIEEAVLLGHKIVIIDGKPGKIKEVIENPLADLSIEEKRNSPEFFAWVNQLRKELYQ